MAAALALCMLGMIGFSISLYFTLVSGKRIAPDQRFLPAACRTDGRTCPALTGTPQARILGLPNSLLGLVYYLGIALVALVGLFRHAPLFPPPGIVIAISAAAALLSLYLAYSLLFILRKRCLLCFASHAVNAAIVILLLLLLQRS